MIVKMRDNNSAYCNELEELLASSIDVFIASRLVCNTGGSFLALSIPTKCYDRRLV